MPEYYVYIVECNDGTLYTGYSNDVEHRVMLHNRGMGAKYTKARLPVTLVYKEKCENKSQSLKREYAIKRYTRDQKKALIRSMDLK